MAGGRDHLPAHVRGDRGVIISEFIIGQEAALAQFADHLGIRPEELSDQRLRMFMGFFHGVYLPTAATVELRLTDLDLADSYRKHGFEPNSPSYGVSTFKVTLRNPSQTNPYRLPAGFTVMQNGVRHIGVEDLLINVGDSSGQAQIRSLVLGETGSGEIGFAEVTLSIGWLIGARQEIIAAVPGRDGSSAVEIQREFANFVANPKALVRGVSHEDYVRANYPGVGRVIASERTLITFEDGRYKVFKNLPGYLSIGVLMENGEPAKEDQRREVYELLEDVTIPYGYDARGQERLSIVPIRLRQIKGTLTVKRLGSAAKEVVRTSVAAALNRAIRWDTWEGNLVTDAHIRAIASGAAGVDLVRDVELEGYLEDDTPSDDEYVLKPFELPINGFSENDVTVV